MSITTKLGMFINNITHTILNGAGGVATLENSGDSSIWDTALTFVINIITNSWRIILTIIMRLLTVVGRFILNIIDFFFIFIRQFLGMSADYSNLESLGGDAVFDFVFSDTVLNIVKYIFILGIVLIIVFSIIAIIKTEYSDVTGGDNSKKHVLVNALKSCFLMIIVPVLFVFSIIFSNAILSALYMATAGGQDISVGTYIWQASTYQANAYRSYADDDQKIPITYTFSNTNDDGSEINFDTINTDGTISDLENAFLAFRNQSGFMQGFKTAVMFNENEFFSIDQIEAAEKAIRESSNGQEHSAYYAVYDNNLYSKKVEYYVMADAIDYCLVKNYDVPSGFFFMSINNVYENHCEVFGTDTVTDLPIEKTVVDGVEGYITRVSYDGEQEETVYFSPAETFDEAQGTVYTLCYSQLQTITTPEGEQVEVELFMPFIHGGDFGFKSDYVTSNGSLVIAKGLFDDEGHPTAIRTNDTGIIEFYRDDIYSPTLLDLFPTITYEKIDGLSDIAWFIRSGFEIFTGLDGDQMIPHIYVNFSAFVAFTKTEKVVARLDSGNFAVDFNMSDPHLSTGNLYAENKINPLILIAGGIVILEALFVVVFALIGRIFDMVVLAITYPGVVSAIPLDGGKMVSGWTESFLNKLIVVYSVTVVLNFSVLVMPIIWSMEMFTPKMVADSIGISLIAGGWTASFLNLLINTMFTLVIFSLIKELSKWLNFMLSSTTLDDVKAAIKKKKFKSVDDYVEKNNDDAFAAGEEVWSEAKNTVKTTVAIAGAVVSGQVVMSAAKAVTDRLADYIPGAAAVTVINDLRKGKGFKDGMKKRSQNRTGLMNDLTAGINTPQDLSNRLSSFQKNDK